MSSVALSPSLQDRSDDTQPLAFSQDCQGQLRASGFLLHDVCQELTRIGNGLSVVNSDDDIPRMKYLHIASAHIAQDEDRELVFRQPI